MTTEERRRLTAAMKKCSCGNVIAKYRADEGAELCSRCEREEATPTLEELAERIARIEEVLGIVP